MRQDTSPLAVRARELAGALASVIFPAPCRICGALLQNASRIPLCEACLACLVPYAGPVCRRCGRTLVSEVVSEGGAQPLCGVCRRGLYDFDVARSSASYTPAVASAIVLLKYEELVPLGRWFAKPYLRSCVIMQSSLPLTSLFRSPCIRPASAKGVITRRS